MSIRVKHLTTWDNPLLPFMLTTLHRKATTSGDLDAVHSLFEHGMYRDVHELDCDDLETALALTQEAEDAWAGATKETSARPSGIGDVFVTPDEKYWVISPDGLTVLS